MPLLFICPQRVDKNNSPIWRWRMDFQPPPILLMGTVNKNITRFPILICGFLFFVFATDVLFYRHFQRPDRLIHQGCIDNRMTQDSYCFCSVSLLPAATPTSSLPFNQSKTRPLELFQFQLSKWIKVIFDGSKNSVENAKSLAICCHL